MYSNEMYRLQAKHFYGYRRQNYSIERRTDNNKNMVYRISPVGFARVTNIRDKGQIIYCRIFIPTNDNRKGKEQVHPFYRFLMKSFIAYQYLLKSQDQTQDEVISAIVKEATDGMPNNKKEEIKKLIDKLIEQVIGKLKNMKDQSATNTNRIKKLQKYNTFLQSQQKNLQQQIAVILNANPSRFGPVRKSDRDLVFSQEYISQQIAALKAIEPLKCSQQEQKLKMFQTRHAQFFEAAILTERLRGFLGSPHLRINRFSDQSEPAIQTLGQFVQLRADNLTEYHLQTESFIRDIYNQLIKYENSTAQTGHRMSYIWLNIDSVIVDQFKLFPKLHYDPPLRQALGLANQPKSAENRLIFNPTPNGPDFFRAPQQFNEQVQLMLKDTYYGNVQCDRDLKLNSIEQNIVKKQRNQLDIIKQKIVLYRFLLVAYYIRNCKCFGRLASPISNYESESYFLKKLREKQKQIEQGGEGGENLEDFIGPPSKKYKGQSFPSKLDELGLYLSIANEDSVIKNHNYSKKIKYLTLKWKLGAQIINILINTTVSFKIANAKKYFMMLLITAIQIFEQARVLITCENLKMGQRQQLRLILQKAGKYSLRLNFQFAKTRFEKLKKYLDRQMKDESAAYLKDNSDYNFKLVQQVYNSILELQNITVSLNQYEDKVQVPSANDRNKYREQTKRALNIIQVQLAKARTLFLELLYVEFQIRSSYQIPFKKPDNQELTKNAYECLTKRFIILAITYFTMNEGNFVLYESTVVPLMKFSEGKQGDEHSNIRIPKTKQEVDTEQSNLKALGEMLNYKQVFPKRLVYLKSPISDPKQLQQIIEEEREFNQKKSYQECIEIEGSQYLQNCQLNIIKIELRKLNQ